MNPELNLVALGIVIGSADASVSPADFSLPWLGDTWGRLQEGERSIAALYEPLTARQTTEISDALDSLPASHSADDLEHFAGYVREGAVDRRVKGLVDRLARKHRGSSLVAELATALIGMDLRDEQAPVPIRDVVSGLWDRAEDVRAGKAEAESGVATGLKALDAQLTFAGLKRGVITVLAGASSSGKSALAKSCVIGAIRSGQRVLWGTFEDDMQAAVSRCLSDVAQVDNRRVRRNGIEGHEWRSFGAAAAELAAAHVWLLDQPPSSIVDLVRQVRRFVAREKIDLVVIDFLQLLPLGHKAESKVSEVTQVATAIQRMSRQLPETATLLVSQTKRTGETCPTKEDLRWSGEIEQLAHTIGLLWKPPVKGYKLVCLNVDKQKDGPTGFVPLAWQPETVSYRDPHEDEAAAYLRGVESLRGGGR